ncbi:hypothetical protein Sjap_020843 [Stephania japonica]|uniref:Vacuolar protein-sorting-associated protein 36 n=1 Tax=Stephania japonica TaxID=461633 RepID=A0AAP0I0Z9_9MAGN
MAGRYLPAAQLTGSGRPVLHPNEIESSLLQSVDVECEENPNFPHLKSGLLILTTHRLLWLPPESPPNSNSSSAAAAAAAIPLAAVTHVFPPKKSVKHMFASPRVRLQVSASRDGVIGERGGEGAGARSLVITLVLRGSKSGGGGDPDGFFGRLWEAWRGRAWEGEGRVRVRRIAMPVVGISGLLRREQEIWESTDKTLQDAFLDLNALMSKAKEMVVLAEKMRQKLLSGLANQANAVKDEEMGSKQEMQDWMLSVGIASPVTKESAGALYHQQLSRQLADFVKLPLEKSGGMIALIDIYCLFNRARGTELISPEDLLQACALWEKFDVPVMHRKFDSGVMVIQNKSHSDEEVFERIKALVLKPDALKIGISPSDAAMTLGIAPAMAKEHLLTAESKGLLCRDVSPEGFRFYINLFKEIDVNNIHL